ncbi:MAG: ABC transporter permease, partial [Pseudanabaena sp.]
AGRVGSAFAAEIGTMQVTEQIDALYMLRTNPIDYLATPRAIACILMLPILTIMGFLTGMAGGLFLSDAMYGISSTMFLNSVQDLLKPWDLIAALLKSSFFGLLIAVIGTTWGLTTTGGAKGVGESTTTAVVTALLAIFISNFFLSWAFFQGIGSSLTAS